MALNLEGAMQYSFSIDVLLHNGIGTCKFDPSDFKHRF